MAANWKFSIDYDGSPEYTKAEIRRIVAEKASELDGRVVIMGNDIYLTGLDDAFVFRIRAGSLVNGGRVSRANV